MKFINSKNITSKNSHYSSFFQKESHPSFFGNETSFFSPPTIQTKLTVNEPNDKYEQEADAMADKVVQRLTTPKPFTKKDIAVQTKSLATPITPFIQTKCAACEQEEKLQKKEEEDLVQESSLELKRKPIFESNAKPPDDEKNIQRKCAECEKEDEQKLQTKSESNATPQTASSSIESNLNASKGAGSPLSESTRTQMESSFGADFSNVRIHNDSSAVQMNKNLNAQAFTYGNDIYFNSEKYDTNSNSGKRLLAHELTHTVQQRENIKRKVIQRETAQEIIERYTNWLGLNLQEERLGEYLSRKARAGEYQIIIEVINAISSSDRDDVGNAILDNLSVVEIISIGKNQSGRNVLTLLRDEVGGGFTFEAEVNKSNLLSAVLEDGPDRIIWNRKRIEQIKTEAGTDLESLARLFADDSIVDSGDLNSRLAAILKVTEHLIVPGLQTGIDFSDTGFRGDRNPGGEGFRDPHPSSQNQVGHFLTAVGLQFSPGVISKPIPLFGTIRSMVGAPSSMNDEEVALRLTIGHEKAPDPNGTAAAINIVLTGIGEDLFGGEEGETEEQKNERVGRAIEQETRRQINAIITAFRNQFNATTEEDIQAWNAALEAVGSGPNLDLAAAEPLLRRISINPAFRGNSIQDLRLSLVGWKLSLLLKQNFFGTRQEVAAWIRRNLG